MCVILGSTFLSNWEDFITTGFWLVSDWFWFSCPFLGARKLLQNYMWWNPKKCQWFLRGFWPVFLPFLPLPWSDLRHAWICRLVRSVTAALHNRAALCPTFSPLHLHNIFHLELELFIYFFDYWSKPNWNPSNILCHLCVLRRLEAPHTEPVYNFIDSHTY